jgi:hypothetical protein
MFKKITLCKDGTMYVTRYVLFGVCLYERAIERKLFDLRGAAVLAI